MQIKSTITSRLSLCELEEFIVYERYFLNNGDETCFQMDENGLITTVFTTKEALPERQLNHYCMYTQGSLVWQTLTEKSIHAVRETIASISTKSTPYSLFPIERNFNNFNKKPLTEVMYITELPSYLFGSKNFYVALRKQEDFLSSDEDLQEFIAHFSYSSSIDYNFIMEDKKVINSMVEEFYTGKKENAEKVDYTKATTTKATTTKATTAATTAATATTTATTTTKDENLTTLISS